MKNRQKIIIQKEIKYLEIKVESEPRKRTNNLEKMEKLYLFEVFKELSNIIEHKDNDVVINRRKKETWIT